MKHLVINKDSLHLHLLDDAKLLSRSLIDGVTVSTYNNAVDALKIDLLTVIDGTGSDLVIMR